MRIIKADIKDADLVGYVHSVAWKQAYKDIFPMDYLETDTPEVRACEFREACREERILYFLLYEDKTAVGIVKVESERNECCEIVSIYILEEYRDKGYGKQFITYLKDIFKYKKIYLWVLEENIKARHFYESNGFCLTGKKREINRGKQFKQDENALGLALTVEKLYDKAELAGVSRVKEKISDLKNIANRLNELDTESNM